MIVPSTCRRFSLLFGCALFLMACSHLWSQCSDSPLNKHGIKAHSIPISDTQIEFQITTPSGQIANLAVQEGGMAKVSDSQLGITYAFVPVLKKVEEKSVDFAIYLITEDKEGNESIRQVERINGNISDEALSQSQPKLQIRLTGINPPATQSSLSDHKTVPGEIKIEMGPAVDCCVFCGDGQFACAGSVCIPSCGGSCHDPGFPQILCNGGNNTSNLIRHSRLALFQDDKKAPLAAQPESAQTKDQQ